MHESHEPYVGPPSQVWVAPADAAERAGLGRNPATPPPGPVQFIFDATEMPGQGYPEPGQYLVTVYHSNAIQIAWRRERRHTWGPPVEGRVAP